MSDDEPPPRGAKIPLILWTALGVILVLAFILAVAAVGRA